ncbi:hypothetical protein HX882_27020 [Pseudomonas gingeri]|uniref:DUF1640 domain-containing protein n=1 Tax=Pseudomonas gingeri TaxID=117681 RepID=A0A7Y8C575_9PSED|nr:hypothetical protein [Pseudomonas gingeri]NWB99544.1 hypothetical protein [Pseudomonas gingeri]
MKLEMALYKALVAANVSEENATAVIDALEEEMSSVLATKADVSALRTEMSAMSSRLELRFTQLIGVMGTAILGMIFAGFKYLT